MGGIGGYSPGVGGLGMNRRSPKVNANLWGIIRQRLRAALLHRCQPIP